MSTPTGPDAAPPGRPGAKGLVLGDASPVRPLDAATAVGTCAARVVPLLFRRRLRQPRHNLGLIVRFADGTSAPVYRETVINRSATDVPTFLAVSFQLRFVHHGWAHRLFRAESLLNTVLFAGFPGLISKLWLRHDQNGVYRGLYQWDGPDLALRYVHALWWVLALVSAPGTVRYALYAGAGLDEVLSRPELLQGAREAKGAWWRPVGTGAPAG